VQTSSRAHQLTATTAAVDADDTAATIPPERLPETVRQVAARPGQLFIDAGRFDGAEFAATRQARLSFLPVRIERRRLGRQTSYHVIAGPFGSVAAADAALDRALAAGVPDARIVVE
jgi:rare lipoprotein A